MDQETEDLLKKAINECKAGFNYADVTGEEGESRE